MDIKKFVKGDCDAAGVSTIYDLYAISNHFGSLNGGHYTAYGKNIDGDWYDYNDSSVSGAGRNVKSASAYLLFYRRRDSPSDGGSTQATDGGSGKSTNEEGKSNEAEDDTAYIYELD